MAAMDDLPIEMNSLWEAAAPGWDDQRLDGAVEANLAIIGAGITGLAAALRAAELGKSVVVVDAARPGWGASGRNGGQVIPGLKLDPDEIVERFGAERGERLTQFAGAAAGRVFELVEKYQIACDAHRGGWIRPAHKTTPGYARWTIIARNGGRAAPMSRCSTGRRWPRRSAVRGMSAAASTAAPGLVFPWTWCSSRGCSCLIPSTSEQRVKFERGVAT